MLTKNMLQKFIQVSQSVLMANRLHSWLLFFLFIVLILLVFFVFVYTMSAVCNDAAPLTESFSDVYHGVSIE